MKIIGTLPRWVSWGLAFPLIVLNGWLFLTVFNYFDSLIGTFIIANLLAFVLNYLVKFLATHGIKRNLAVLIVFICAFLILGTLGLTLTPIAISQLNELIVRLPSWFQSGLQQLQAFNDLAVAHNIDINLTGLANQLTVKLSSQLQSFTGQALSIVLGTVGSTVDVLLSVVLTFYLLLHGEELWDGVNQWLPQPKGNDLRELLKQNFENYYIGQASLAAIVAVSMTTAFVVLRLPLGLLFGLIVGFMALFPFGLSFSIITVSLLMALRSFWLGIKVLVVAVLIQQLIENVIAPRLLGGFTGLNPVWILVVLLIGAKVGGVLGLLVAVPLAGFVKSASHLFLTKPTDYSSFEDTALVTTKETVS
jgi:predicted PurR-regulated permease PerM